ncbi:hypothetical protein HNP50_000566 [Elizabethkingia anophelis]|nr:hypothetical protein [Elizabethkingia anophelis]MCW2466194.1 hypothetical protein [Elizabethkingia anophelis]MCW2469878.1 hypothetical protein [Elizabethkingia anophelis]
MKSTAKGLERVRYFIVRYNIEIKTTISIAAFF